MISCENEEFWVGMSSYIYRKEIKENAPREIDSIFSSLRLSPVFKERSQVLDCSTSASLRELSFSASSTVSQVQGISSANEIRSMTVVESVRSMIPEPMKILDLACGTGRHSLELARRNYSVTAVDKYSSVFKEAKNQSVLENLDVAWIEKDMRHYCKSNYFDLVLNMFYSFGFFSDIEEDIVVLSNVFSSLKPGGKCVLELLGSEIALTGFQRRIWDIADDRSILLIDRQFLDDVSWLNEKYIVISNETMKEYFFGMRLYSSDEIARLLLKQGFVNIKILGDLNGSSYDTNAQRLVVMAEKPLMASTSLRC